MRVILSQFRLLLVMIAASLGLGVTTVMAQPIAWNPPCPTATVVNNTGCTLTLNLFTAPPGAVPPIAVPPCTILAPVAVPPGTIINGVFSQAGTAVPMAPGTVPPATLSPCPLGPPAGPATGEVRGITLGPAPGCCVDIFFYATPGGGCTIYIQSPPPPPPVVNCIP